MMRFTGNLHTDYCPKCKSNNQVNLLSQFFYDKDTGHYFVFASCHLCQKVFMYEYGKIKRSGKVSSQVSFNTELEFVYRYPANDVTIYDSVKGTIRNLYLEGVKCLNANSPNASVMVFRRTLQEICKNKNTTKKDLKDQINEVIPSELKEVAHELRLWGNLGAHPDDIIKSVSINDAIELQEFIDKVLYALYEYPAKLQNKQSKRKGS